MRLTDAQQQMLKDYADRYPVPTGETERQEWTHRLAEQFRYSFGTPWGHKSAGPGRPHSKDAIAYKFGDAFWAYDTINGATGALISNPDPIDIHGQIFEVVAPVNHMGAPVPPPPDEDPGTPQEILDRLDQIIDDLMAVAALLRR